MQNPSDQEINIIYENAYPVVSIDISDREVLFYPTKDIYPKLYKKQPVFNRRIHLNNLSPPTKVVRKSWYPKFFDR